MSLLGPDSDAPVDVATKHMLKLAELLVTSKLLPEEYLDECQDVLNTLRESRSTPDEYKVSLVRIETAASPEEAVDATECTKWSWTVENMRTGEVVEIERIA